MRAWIAGLMLLALPAAAQSPASESVTVTGTRQMPQAALKAFVQSFAAPSHMTGKIGKWESGICPVTVGLPVAGTRFITRRIRSVAIMVGAPVAARADCRPNIEIVFTTTPQGLADTMRQKHPVYLGYHDNDDQAAQLAQVTHPIQAWYTTATVNLIGKVKVDSGSSAGMCDLDCGDLFSGNSTGMRLADGHRTSFYHIVIAANPNRLVGHEMGALADYIAMLALSEPSALDTCWGVPSITNLLAPGCDPDRVTNGLTDADAGYLRGLYAMTPDAPIPRQQDEISYRMKQSLEDR